MRLGGAITRIFKSFSVESETYTEDFEQITHESRQVIYAAEGTHYFKDWEPSEEEKPQYKHFVKGWWTDNDDKPITEALLNDYVKFHIETKDIPDGDAVYVTLFDDDRRINLFEDGHNDKIKLETKAGKEVIYRTVTHNKIEIGFELSHLEAFLKEETDGVLELFFACSYENVHVDLPRITKNYLKVKGLPKIIFVNGQWKIAANMPLGENFGPTIPKKPYWADGIDQASIDYLDIYFKIKKKYIINDRKIESLELEKHNYILYCDGSSNYGGDQSGGDRFANGRNFAKNNYKELIKGLGNEAFYLISHSEGGAYAAGMADYLFEQGHKIGEHILLSPDEADEFSINPAIPSYQLLYMFFSTVLNPAGTLINHQKAKINNKGFRMWGKYYAIVDWMVNEFKIQGITKMGIVHEQSTGWFGVHGWTNSKDIFNEVSDLKEVLTMDVMGSDLNGKYYTGKGQTITNTKFYRIDDEYIISNCPPVIKID